MEIESTSNDLVEIARAVVGCLVKITIIRPQATAESPDTVTVISLTSEDAAKVLAIALGSVIFDATSNNQEADRAINSLIESVRNDMYSMRQAMAADTTTMN